MKKAIAALALLAIALPQGAIAATFDWQETPTNSQKVYITGLAPNSSVEVKVPLRLFAQEPKYCGYVRVKYPAPLDRLYLYTSTGDEIGNDISSSDANCSSGVWKNSSGTVTPPNYFYKSIDSNNIYVFIKATSAIDINSEGAVKTVQRQTNACGITTVTFKKFSISSWNPFVQVGNQSSSFLSPSDPPICKNGVLYRRLVP